MRMRPPTRSSRTKRTNWRYWRERVFWASPVKGMITSCATFWLSVSELIQRRTDGFSVGLRTFLAFFLGGGLTAGITGADARAMMAIERKKNFRTSDGLGCRLYPRV